MGKRVLAVEQPSHGFGDVLRGCRQDVGMTQFELAERARVSVRTLRDIERNRFAHPRTRSVRRLAAALGLSEADLRRPAVDADAPSPRGGVLVAVLGPLSVRVGDVPVEVNAPMQRCLLGLLAVQPRQPVSRQEIVDVLWGECPPRTCLALVNTYVGRLRQLVEPGRSDRAAGNLIVLVRGGYRLELDNGQLDLDCFDDLVARGHRARAAGDPDRAWDLFGRALGCWRGPVLADLGHRLTQHPAVVAVGQRRLTAAAAYADVGLELGRHDEVISRLRSLTADAPLHEGLHARLMLALAGAGQQAAALELFTALRARLGDELGIEPGPELRAANLRVLRQDLPVPAARPAPGPVPGAAPAAPRGAVLPTPAQLPADVATFAGRAAQLRRLDALATRGRSGATPPVLITAIAGTAGVGKTALAVHWAHRVAGRFGDGQLYVNLRGFDPSGPPVTPSDAIRGFLDALGVPAGRIPADLPAQAALYRSLLAGRRVLVLLDNARDVEQVRPLLPGSPGCLAVVTSRNQMSGLVVAGARPLVLDLLTDAEARQMLARRLGRRRVAAEPAAVDEIIVRCARLPLALAIVAARAAAHPGFRLATLADELGAAHGGLDGFAGGDPASDARAVFSWSYRTLGTPAARLFRLLGLHPGPDVTAAAAASLAGVPLARVRPLLADLAAAHLVEEPVPGRFTFHDVLRAYATELAHAGEPEAARRAAVHRMLDHYRDTARGAALLVSPYRDAPTHPPTRPGVAVTGLSDRGEAMAWFKAEHPVLLAAIGQTVRAGFDAHTWPLAWSLVSFLELTGRWQDWVDTQCAALAVAERRADRVAQAHAHRYLGSAYEHLGDCGRAYHHFGRALDVLGALGDRKTKAHTHSNLAAVFEREGRYREAVDHTYRALDLYRAVGFRAGEARALNGVGFGHALLGEYGKTLTYCRQALDLSRELDEPYGQCAAWDSLGYAHHHLGRAAEAFASYQRALDLARDLGDRQGEAEILIHVGDAHEVFGHPDRATDAWQRALAILDELRDPDAGKVRARLRGLGPGTR